MIGKRTAISFLLGLIAFATVACGSTGNSASVVPNRESASTPVPFMPTPASPTSTPDLTFQANDERRALRFKELGGWETDFTQKLVGLDEFISILNRDGIDPLDAPTFVPVSSAPDYMEPREPVIALEINGDARAYPLAMLMWHEIVNDTVGGEPVTVTFCPLCNTAISFSRVVDGVELTFGTTGKVRHSDLVMWDRQTESWWQQITGEALVGHYAGVRAKLAMISSPIIAWETFAEHHPDGVVMERIFDEFGFPVKRYDLPPYAGYDSVDASPFAIDAELDGRMPPNLRVLTIERSGDVVAYPFPFLSKYPVLNDRVGDVELVAFFDDGTISAFVDPLDREITSGSTTVFRRDAGGRSLTFELADGEIRDLQTGSAWNLLGLSTSGELSGTQLEPVIHGNHFWFAWAVFKPDTSIRDERGDIEGPVHEGAATSAD